MELKSLLPAARPDRRSLNQFAFFGLLTAILALKRPYLTLDVWVRRSPHNSGLSAAMWAGDWFNIGLFSGGFFPRFNLFCHVPTPGPHADCRPTD